MDMSPDKRISVNVGWKKGMYQWLNQYCMISPTGKALNVLYPDHDQPLSRAIADRIEKEATETKSSGGSFILSHMFVSRDEMLAFKIAYTRQQEQIPW